MAKSSRSSTKKENNRRKAATIFGPAELARNERLSAKLLELAKQPQPEPGRDVAIDTPAENHDGDDIEGANEESNADETVMDLDSKEPSRARGGKKRVEKRRNKKSSIVFTKYSERLAAKKKKKNGSSQRAA
ncbi:hypothetical protein CDD83_6832 [Cordyceps sp. RAO-2017]|nr:hypothetical protein CDD83_6832 [Cordyceps sp. RAO-2017]